MSSEIHYKWAKGQDSIGIQVSQVIDTNDYKFTEYKANEKHIQLSSGSQLIFVVCEV